MGLDPAFEGTVFQTHYPDRFTWSEYGVFAVLLACSMGIGIFHGFFSKGNKTNEEFLMAGRSMTVFPVSWSLICSFISAITLLGNPVEVYFYGMQYITFIFSFLWISLAVAYIYVPVFYNLRLLSVFEYFELRFNRKLRVLLSVAQIIHSLLYMPTTVFGPAIALEAVAGFNATISSAIIFLVCIAYSSMGGFKAVLWTDVLQGFVMFGAMFATIGVGTYNAGGIGKVWELGTQTGRTELLNFDTDPRTRHTFWTGAVGGYFLYMPIFACSQMIIQRYLSVPTLAKARRCIFISMAGFWFIIIMCSLIGLIIFATYAGCDPIKLGKIKNSDQLLPLFVMDVLGNIPLLPGLFVAGITAGSLSSVSSVLNSLAAIVTEDYVKSYWPLLSDTKLAFVSKIVTIISGLIAFALVFVIASVGNILPFTSVTNGVLFGPVLGCATLGMFFPWANWIGVIFAIIPSAALTAFVGIGTILAGQGGQLPNQRLPFMNDKCYLNSTVAAVQAPAHWKDNEYSGLINLFSVSYMFQPATPVVCTIVLGAIFSFIVRRFKQFPRYSSSYISPPILALWIGVIGRSRLRSCLVFEDEKAPAHISGAGEHLDKIQAFNSIQLHGKNWK